ncbi:MAG: family 43 glycosylhydrolase [Acidobacteriota bacterium]|nr:family 43 glycosylhydrolase [Acidobacteriota bacterium]
MKPQRSKDKHRYLKEIFALACVYLWLLFLASNLSAQTYTNPVIPGDFPDPSVIRVGKDYYATATTGGWAPHFPILHSKDLVNWRVVSSVFDKKPAWAKGDFWAPEIAEDKGKFYVFYTARRDEGKDKKGTLCVAVAVADKPDGTYTDKGALICQEMGSIDGFFIRDDKGVPYLIWKEDGNDRGQPTWMYAAELEADLTKLKGKPQRLFSNEGTGWENHVVEGADVVRRNGWFYMFYSGNACCGRSCNYAMGVARAKRILGFWEKYPKNPILDENDAWQCPGHGTIAQTPDGRDFMLYHAYRKSSDAFNIGREGLLDKIEWTADGWAQINGGRGPSKTAQLPFANSPQKTFSEIINEFNDSLIEPDWQYPMFNDQIFRLENGFLKIFPTEKQLSSENLPELVLAERTVSGNYTATTRIDISNLKNDEFAGLSAYSWRTNAVGVSVSNGKIFTWKRGGGKHDEISSVSLPANLSAIVLKLETYSGESYRFSFSTDEKKWQQIGEQISERNVEGARVALVYRGKTTNPSARFDWLRINNGVFQIE